MRWLALALLLGCSKGHGSAPAAPPADAARVYTCEDMSTHTLELLARDPARASWVRDNRDRLLHENRLACESHHPSQPLLRCLVGAADEAASLDCGKQFPN